MTLAHQLEIGLSANKNSFTVCVYVCTHACDYLSFAIRNLTTGNSGLVEQMSNNK